jgi:hypothetical protein
MYATRAPRDSSYNRYSSNRRAARTWDRPRAAVRDESLPMPARFASKCSACSAPIPASAEEPNLYYYRATRIARCLTCGPLPEVTVTPAPVVAAPVPSLAPAPAAYTPRVAQERMAETLKARAGEARWAYVDRVSMALSAEMVASNSLVVEALTFPEDSAERAVKMADALDAMTAWSQGLNAFRLICKQWLGDAPAGEVALAPMPAPSNSPDGDERRSEDRIAHGEWEHKTVDARSALRLLHGGKA